jgi:hypothetical protein
MTVVLKSNSNIKEKISDLLDSLDVRETSLTIIVSENMYEQVHKEFSGLNLGKIKYGKELVYISKKGIAITIKKVNKYI